MTVTAEMVNNSAVAAVIDIGAFFPGLAVDDGLSSGDDQFLPAEGTAYQACEEVDAARGS